MEKVFSYVRNAAVNLLDAGASLLPVAAEFHFSAHPALRPGELIFMLFETVQWLDETVVGERGEAGDTHVDADHGSRRMHWLFHFALGLY